MVNHNLVGGIPTRLTPWKMMEFVNGKDDNPIQAIYEMATT